MLAHRGVCPSLWALALFRLREPFDLCEPVLLFEPVDPCERGLLGKAAALLREVEPVEREVDEREDERLPRGDGLPPRDFPQGLPPLGFPLDLPSPLSLPFPFSTPKSTLGHWGAGQTVMPRFLFFIWHAK